MNDSRYKQANKEARLAFGLTVFYLVGWCLCAYLAPEKAGFFGFPLWFELACFYLPVIFIVLTYFVIKLFFQDISLEKSSLINLSEKQLKNQEEV